LNAAAPRLPATFIWLITGLIALHACMAATRVVASLWVLREGHDERTMGLILSLFAVAPIVLSMWAGRLADRHGLQRPVRLATVMGLMGTSASALAPNLLTVGLAALLTGGALCVAAVAIQRGAGQLAHQGHDLKRIFSWVALGPALSNVLAPLLSGFVIDHAGLRWAFAVLIALPLLSLALLSRVGRRLSPPALRAPAASAAGVASVALSPVAQPAPSGARGASGLSEPLQPAPSWALLRSRPLRVLLLLNLSMAAAWDAHTFAVPVVGHLREMSASEIGFIFASFAMAATAVRLIIVRWSSRIQEALMLRGAMALAATVLLVYAWLPGLLGLMLGSAVLGLALGSVQPMVLSMLHQVTPADRQGQALGLRMMVTNAATVAMPMLYGVMSASLTTAAPLWLMAAGLLLAQRPAMGLAALVSPPSPDVEAERPSKAPGP
jgi:MFS family permease